MTDQITTGKTTKSEQTKQRIIRTYLHLIEEKKWDRITVKELCSHAEITRGTFYQYYGDIYELMEQIQDSLLDELARHYNELDLAHAKFPLESFLEKYDYEPPEMFLMWFEFCKEHRETMLPLLDKTNGDVYFEKKLKRILYKYINEMMDGDGLPRDGLRNYFVKACAELHLISICSWLDVEESSFLSTEDIVNLLNTMRVGAGYLTYKRNIDPPEFQEKIHITPSNPSELDETE